MSEKQAEKEEELKVIKEKEDQDIEAIKTTFEKEESGEKALVTPVARILEKEFMKRMRERLENLSKNVNYPSIVYEAWFRIKPHEKFLKAWYTKWADIIITYARKNGRFLFSLLDLLNTFPFKDKEGRGLGLEDIKVAVNLLVQKGIAKFLDEEHIVILWLAPRKLAQIIYEEAINIGLEIVRMSVLSQLFPDLPREIILKTLDILVKDGKAKWIGKDFGVRIYF
ncbi:MAG: hypothetical protein ACTSX9_01805 [Candidatus Njordarchaeales archaeon]